MTAIERPPPSWVIPATLVSPSSRRATPAWGLTLPSPAVAARRGLTLALCV
jgi:hypothetical protein